MTTETTTSTKHCPRCDAHKPLTEFAWKSKSRGYRHSHCRTCNRSKSQAHYQTHKAQYVEKAARHNETYRARNAALVEQALEGQSCACCAATEELTFYQGPDTATQPVHMALHASVSEAAMLDAIARSVVVCRACLGRHFISGVAHWQRLDGAQRAAMQAQRQAEGYVATPHDHYKRYRAVQG